MKKRIFFFTARIPLVQLVTIVVFGGIAYMLARQIEVGTYTGFEVFPEKAGSSYMMAIPEEHEAEVPEGSPGKWCFNKLAGRRWPLIYRNGSYELDIRGLGPEELERLDSGTAKVYVEFRTDTEKLLSW